MDNAEGLHILQWNCRSLYHKLPEFKEFIMTLNPKPDVIMLQETHLIEKYSPRLPGYEVIRKDRTIHGGGLATFIKNNLNFTQIVVEVDRPIEAQFFQISGIKMANIYIPPTTSAVSFQFLSKLSRKSLIFGDFNAHHQTWSNSPTTGRGHALARALDDYDMVLLNTEHPTRLNLSTNAIAKESLIDLSIASRDIAFRCNTIVSEMMCGSDHFPVSTFISWSATRTPKTAYWNYKKANWDLFATVAKGQLSNLTESEDVNVLCNEFCAYITEAAKLSIPSSKSGNHKTPVPWWSEDCRRAVRQTRAAFSKMKRTWATKDIVNF